MSDSTYYLDINGLSKHFGDPPEDVEEYNEANLGLGITYETLDDNNLAKMLSAGYFNNSFNDPTLYAGYGMGKRFGNEYYAQLGGMAGLMTGYDTAVMPMGAGTLSLGKKDLGRLNFLYAPGIDDKDALIMMNLGIPFK